MVETRSVLRTHVHDMNSAADILTMLNNQLDEDLTSAELFITMFYVKYDVANRMLTYANAGHNHPLLYRRDHEGCIELDADGLILGVRRGVVFEEKTIQLQQDDILLLYTDGITEAQNGSEELFGEERLCQVLTNSHLETPFRIIELILEEVAVFSGHQPLNDDVSMVVMKVSPAGESAE
jgi:sigma-B regulation protein RsbU (phosphoserine phosphatase)